jgi:hypothetical protein
MKKIISMLFTLAALHTDAQEIAGKIIDDARQPLSSAVVSIYQGSTLKGTTFTDYDGNVSGKFVKLVKTAKQLDPKLSAK